MNRLHLALVAGLALCMPAAYAQNQSSQSDTQHMQSKDQDQGKGVRHGNNEGGSDRATTAEQPTGAPGTGDASAQSDKRKTDATNSPTKKPQESGNSSK